MLRRVGQGSLYGLEGKLWILRKHFVGRQVVCDSARNYSDRYTRSFDAGFTVMNFGVDHNIILPGNWGHVYSPEYGYFNMNILTGNQSDH
jgi:hypothetical protein